MRFYSTLLLGLVLAGFFLVGCAGPSGGSVGLAPLTNSDSTYLKQKIDTALGRADLVKSIQVVVYAQNDHRLLITLYSGSAGADEMVCMKALRALARDPLIPQVDSVITVTCKESVHWVRISGATTSLEKFANIEEGDPIFKCGLSRDALLRGAEPEVWMRNGRFVPQAAPVK